MFRKALKSIRNNILVGLILATPIVVTSFVVNWMFTFITNRVLVFLPREMREGDRAILWRLAALLIVLLLLYLVGVLVRNILGKRLYQLGDKLLGRIPFINRLYIGTRQVIEALFQQRRTLFQEVVLIEYPRRGVYAMGFVTAAVPVAYTKHLNSEAAAQECVSIFIPTTPNPTSGWFCIAPRSEIIHLDISTGEAMKLIVSGGAVYPGQGPHTASPSLLDMLHDWTEKEEGAPGPGRPAAP